MLDHPFTGNLPRGLLNAIENNELVVHYQPEYNLVSGQYEGVEALVRWQHPEQGLLLPQDFLYAIQDTDHILPIGEWVLRTACLQNKMWQNNGLLNLRVAVNVAARQMLQHDFVELVIDVLKSAQLQPQFLELEINENTILCEGGDRIVQTIHQLHDYGVKIALDDFGTGYTSLSHLKKIPIHRIKIDKTFIDNIHANVQDAAIVRALVVLAASMKIRVLAEGVELMDQLKSLISHECEEVQGFYFSKPLPADEVEKLILFPQSYQF